MPKASQTVSAEMLMAAWEAMVTELSSPAPVKT